MSESIAMPYDCAFDGVRVLLRPSEIRNYQVIGEREERQVTACATPGSNDCRTLMAHRFAISCGGRRVPWMRVVAAARRTASRDMWVEGGRIHLAVERRSGAPSRCADGSRRGRLRAFADGGGDGQFGLPLAECLPWQRDRSMTHVALPPGFAPLGEIGARLLIGGTAPPAPPVVVARAADRFDPIRPQHGSATTSTDAAMGAESRDDALTGVGPPITPRADGSGDAVAAEPLPEAAPIPIVLTGSDPSRTWVTLVRPEAQIDIPARLAGPLAGPFAGTLASPSIMAWSVAALLASLLAAGVWTMWRREREPALGLAAPAAAPDSGLGEALKTAASRFPFRAAARPATGPAFAPSSSAEVSVTNAAASVTALIEQANGSLDVLRGAPPLREVLEQEIGVIRQRLAIVKAQASEGPEAAHKAAPAFRTLVRDLERVRRISESAALSFAGQRIVGRVPRTRSEAYDALGVNADVSAETLKKLVDALRMCWHPDLARDEADRLVREERIKCINVAWELISGKRVSA